MTAFLACAYQAAAGPLDAPGCLAGGTPAKVVSVSESLEVGLDDGRTVLLPGVDPVRPSAVDPEAARKAQAALSLWLVGRAVTVNARAAAPDRWGRTVAPLFADRPEQGAAVSVGEAMIDAGLGRAKPDPAVSPCWSIYRTLEARARSGGLGLWRDPSYAVAAAADADGLARRTGTMVIVEGQIAAIRPGRSRTYLAFDDRTRSGFTVAIERRTAVRLEKAGVDFEGWRGKRLRVRGFLDDRFGLQIDLTSLDQVEFIDP